jgi:hypothetical protein
MKFPDIDFGFEGMIGFSSKKSQNQEKSPTK